MMLQIDFTSIKKVWKSWKGIVLTSSVNYLIQPFVMYGLAVLFFNFVFSSLISDTLQLEYIAGSVILGGSPCTAMVFVWSFLLDGDASYTLAQVVVNDLILLVAYIPTIQLLLSLSGVLLPWLTLVFSLVVFVVIPIISGGLLRWYIVSRHGVDYLEHKVMPKMKPLTIIFLLLTLVLIFIFQSDQVVKAPLHILLIAVPLTIQTVFIWAITFAAAYFLKLPFRIAGPASLIASSNFFELAVAVAVSILGADSGATLVTTVGVLTEVPIMLALVYFCNRSKDIFKTQ
jgi:ACR3 family arsenite transporter